MPIPLHDKFQREQFERAMKTLRENKDSLRDYDRRLFNDLDSAYEMLGLGMSLTVKQLNHIKQVAFEIEKGL